MGLNRATRPAVVCPAAMTPSRLACALIRPQALRMIPCASTVPAILQARVLSTAPLRAHRPRPEAWRVLTHGTALQFSTTAPSDKKDSDEKAAAEQEKLGVFRSTLRKYGFVFVSTYATVYVVTLSGLYVGLASGGITAGDISDASDGVNALDKLLMLLDLITFPVEYIEMIKSNPKAGNFALAWLTTKLTEPLRLAFSAAVTPAIARKLGRAPPKEA